MQNTHAVHDSAISRLLSNLELENGARLDEVLIKELAITAYVGTSPNILHNKLQSSSLTIKYCRRRRYGESWLCTINIG